MRPREYDISGVVMLRRRLGGVSGGVVDVQTSVSADDGRYIEGNGGFSSTTTADQLGLFTGPEIGNVWSRFLSVAIPNGATIDVAYITVNCRFSGNDGVNTKSNIYFEDEDSPTAPTTAADASGRSRTTAFTPWDDVDMIVNADLNSPSIVDVIQEIVNRPGWATGQNMQLLWDDDGSSLNKFYDVKSVDEGTEAIILHVEFS